LSWAQVVITVRSEADGAEEEEIVRQIPPEYYLKFTSQLRELFGVVFDETFIHRAVNDTDEARIILFCDVERPLRTRAFRRLNRWVATHVVPLTAARNDEGEPIGLANRVSRHVHALGQHRRRFKREHRASYRFLRYALVALALWLVLAPLLAD